MAYVGIAICKEFQDEDAGCILEYYALAITLDPRNTDIWTLMHLFAERISKQTELKKTNILMSNIMEEKFEPATSFLAVSKCEENLKLAKNKLMQGNRKIILFMGLCMSIAILIMVRAYIL